MEFIVPLIIAAGVAYLYFSFKKSKKEVASIEAEAPYKVEAPVAAVVETQVTDAVTTPAKVKLRQPGSPKQGAKKPTQGKKPQGQKKPAQPKQGAGNKPKGRKPKAKPAAPQQ